MIQDWPGCSSAGYGLGCRQPGGGIMLDAALGFVQGGSQVAGGLWAALALVVSLKFGDLARCTRCVADQRRLGAGLCSGCG